MSSNSSSSEFSASHHVGEIAAAATDSEESLANRANNPDCFHCGLAVTTGDLFSSTIQERSRLFCCAGCQAVAGFIHEGGLDQFYQYRSELNKRPESEKIDFKVYDQEAIQASFVRPRLLENTHSVRQQKIAHLLLDGITCAACVWLIEKYLLAIKGVSKVSVNAGTHQCTVTFDPSQIPLSQLMEQLFNIGYRPQPYTQADQQQQQRQQQRRLLFRLGLAGIGMMLVGMIAVSLHAGAIQGIEAQWVQLFRWVSLLVATPIVLFSAQPFWSSAWRNLKRGHLTMDVPVSLAIILAYLASAWATWTQSGEVYFDSISMFTFFLLMGRYFELRLRYRNQQMAGLTSQLLPMTVTKVSDVNTLSTDPSDVVVALAELNVGDHIRVASGETIPADGVIVEGSSAVIEAVLTGEAEPIRKRLGDSVIAGTVNTESTLLLRVVAVGDQTRLSTISQLVEEAEQDKPKLQLLADRVASVFVAVVLCVAALVFFTWRAVDPDAALWITLSVLVVTCPCALSLATPTALTAAVAMMRRQGLLVLKGHVIETLTAITKVIFDKTGTLTYGRPTIVSVDVLDKSLDQNKILSIAAALEKGSSHPIAFAFENYAEKRGAVLPQARDINITTGAGVSGYIDDALFRLGKPDFAIERDKDCDNILDKDNKRIGQWVLLSRNNNALAWIELSDQLRDSAKQAIDELNSYNIKTEILSGDRETSVKLLANQLNIGYRAEHTPEKKLLALKTDQDSETILMVGDGINDVPVLAGADISVAMDTATDFARTRADSVLLNNTLSTLPLVIQLAHKSKRIIRQNITWALGYNLLALPLAAMGYIPPYLAAIGMSLSSLIVVLNALRLYKHSYKLQATSKKKGS